MKKITGVLLIMICMGLQGAETTSIEKIQQSVKIAIEHIEVQKQFEVYEKKLLPASKILVNNYKDYMTTDYLAGMIVIREEVWDAIDLQLKWTLVLELIINMEHITHSNDICIIVNSTIVFQSYDQTIIKERIF